MTTGLDLVSGALRVVTTVAPGEAIDGPESDNALTVLNRMLKAWSASSLMVPYRTTENFPLTIGKVSYTIGTSGITDLATPRPDYITNLWRRDANNNDFKIISYTQDQYDDVQVKSLTGLPQWGFYDTQFPNGVLSIYPADSQADTLFIVSLKPFNQFTTLSTVMALPGEYEEAIVYLLAKRLAPEYGFTITPDIADLISQSERAIERKNTRPSIAGFDPALSPPRPFNIFEG